MQTVDGLVDEMCEYLKSNPGDTTFNICACFFQLEWFGDNKNKKSLSDKTPVALRTL